MIYLVVPAYFERYKGAVTASIMMGISAGVMITPPLIRILIDEYSFKGCALIFGALLANCCVASMVFHPVERHQRKPNKDSEKSLSAIYGKKDFNSVKETAILKQLAAVFKSSCEHMKQIRELRLALITVLFPISMVGYSNFTAQLPFALAESGYVRSMAPRCISIAGFCSLVVRLFIAFVSDRKWFSRKICFLLGHLFAGASNIGNYFHIQCRSVP